MNYKCKPQPTCTCTLKRVSSLLLIHVVLFEGMYISIRPARALYLPGFKGSWIAIAAMSVYIAALVTEVMSVAMLYVS